MMTRSLKSIFTEAGRSQEQYVAVSKMADRVIEEIVVSLEHDDGFSANEDGTKAVLRNQLKLQTPSGVPISIAFTLRRSKADAVDAVTKWNQKLCLVVVRLNELIDTTREQYAPVLIALRRKLKHSRRELRDVLLHEFVHVLDIDAGKFPDVVDASSVTSPHEFNAYMHDLRSEIEGKLEDMRIPDRRRMLDSPSRFVNWVLQTLEKRRTFWNALSQKQKRTAIKSIASWQPNVALQLAGRLPTRDVISEIGFYGGYHSMAGGSEHFQTKQLFDEWPPGGYGPQQLPEDDPTLDDNSDGDFYNGRSPDSPDFSGDAPTSDGFSWSGMGCDVCGYGSVDNVENFDPKKKCPECGTVMLHVPTSMDKVVKQVPGAWASPGSVMNAPMGERLIRTLVREVLTSSESDG